MNTITTVVERAAYRNLIMDSILAPVVATESLNADIITSILYDFYYVDANGKTVVVKNDVVVTLAQFDWDYHQGAVEEFEFDGCTLKVRTEVDEDSVVKSFGTMADKLVKEVIAETKPETKIEKEEVIMFNVYAEGSYVKNVTTGKMSKVGTEFVVGEKVLVHTFQFLGKGIPLRDVTVTAQSLMNVKVYAPITVEEVLKGMNTVVVPVKAFEVNVTRSDKGYRNWTVTDTKTKEVFQASEGKTTTDLIRSYKTSYKGQTVNVTVKKVVDKVEVKSEPVVETRTRKCSCCGKVVTEKQHAFIAKRENQACLPVELKGKDYCFGCQDKVVDVKTGFSVKFLIKKFYTAKKAVKVSLSKDLVG